VLALYDPGNPTSASAAEVARVSAAQLRVALHERHVRSREEVLATLREVDRGEVDAILVLPDSLVVNAGDEIIATAERERLPTMFHEDSWVRRGGLAAYGASFADLGRQAATYVDRILKGTRAADLPVQQATTFELVVNLQAARALGLTLTPSLLAQVDEVIQ
jgi:putative ABC transport system substrate-binding protein